MDLDRDYLEARLTALVEKHGVVGASLGVALGDAQVFAAAGVLNRRTGEPASTESVFQIGSITKVWTTTLAMQLVDEARLDLDEPITTYLPELALADAGIPVGLTARHLMAHTSGLVGDFFPDTGRGEDCLERFVAELRGLEAVHPLGATYSYCNAGFSLLGRLIEVISGATWDEVLHEQLLHPLQLEAAGTFPEEALLWSAAVGHVGGEGAQLEVAPIWCLSRNVGPAGLIHARARDVVEFGRMHLRNGLGPDGSRLLSERSSLAMRTPQVAVPEPWSSGTHAGLGWALWEWSGAPVYGHDGATIGQDAFFRVVPGAAGRPDLIIVLLCNGGAAGELYHDLFDEIASHYVDLRLPTSAQPPTPALVLSGAELERYQGTYQHESIVQEVHCEEHGLRLVTHLSGPVAMAVGSDTLETALVPIGDDCFVGHVAGLPGWTTVVFYRLADGRQYLHCGGRAAAKVGSRP